SPTTTTSSPTTTTSSPTTTTSSPTTTTSTTTTNSDSAFKCYSCGNFRNNVKNEECKTYTNVTTECPQSECWIYRNETDGTVTYARGCRSTDRNLADFKCSDYTTEVCIAVSSTKLCSQCCTSNKCNTGDLTGSRSSASTSFSGLFLVVAVATIVVSLTE
ncbi:hypothetical protein LSAT2_023347, partial [Lamellibrachia satsuma]